ncbi:cobalamin-binding protein [Methylobacillus flagellatus]|uniref:Periplasmic binding protein n=1 Tax=Methylobacillus flagellatus (strain ATCC 51484 / DSM 6875 / VKM B-1610 / KT) TaxID=265072 RepID=Q1GXI2_METFK|nr:cobalamin-binding protein [Methylobacillus flagellatus]ABE48385.1 periplasmic binding protein [Methylobacillus flagellatus KT]
MKGPRRIACLTAEATEVLYLLGEQARIVGISGFTTRPAIARQEKPKISGFSTAKIEKILAVKPDLVLAFSNLQADIAADLVRAGVEVHVFNQRSVQGILDMVATLGALTHATDRAEALIAGLRQRMQQVAETASYLPTAPKVYFEEWNDPLISGVQWVAELIEMAGGRDCFADLSAYHSAKERIITDPDEVVRRQPDIIIGSWCGKKFQPEHVLARPGWHTIPAVQSGQVHEIKSADILQPGPSAILHGLPQLQTIMQRWGVSQAHSKHWS